MTPTRPTRATLALALAAATLGAATASAEPATVHVRVLPAHYVVGEQRFADARTLEAHVRSLRARTIAFDDCAPGSSPARLSAAVERLLRASDEIAIRSLPTSDPVCVYAQGTARRAPTLPAVRVHDAAHLAVDRRGRSILP